MTISDQSRYLLHQRLDAVLGADEAATLMEHLPPVGWADVATKRDLERLAIEVRAEMATGFAEVRSEFADVRSEFADVRSEMATGFADVRSEMATEFADVRSEMRVGLAGLRGELHKEIGGIHETVGTLRGDVRGQLQTLFVGLVGLQVSSAGLAVALSRVR